jgi:YhcH/YjgK/YiaL family protein
MKRLYSTVYVFILVTVLLLPAVHSNAQADTAWTKQKAAGWYKQGKWLNGLELQPYNGMDQQEFARQYHAHPQWWDKAFAFLRENKLDSLQPGKYVIDGDNVFADVTVNPSTPLNEAKWHSHKNYCDIQYVISGSEQVGAAPIAGAEIVTPFNDKGDSQFYISELKGTYYTMKPGTFYIFFPSDVHRPFIKIEGAGPVKRIRFKVKTRMSAN